MLRSYAPILRALGISAALATALTLSAPPALAGHGGGGHGGGGGGHGGGGHAGGHVSAGAHHAAVGHGGGGVRYGAVHRAAPTVHYAAPRAVAPRVNRYVAANRVVNRATVYNNRPVVRPNSYAVNRNLYGYGNGYGYRPYRGYGNGYGYGYRSPYYGLGLGYGGYGYGGYGYGGYGNGYGGYGGYGNGGYGYGNGYGNGYLASNTTTVLAVPGQYTPSASAYATGRTYSPGNGILYQLYYDPATGVSFFYS